MNAPRRKTQTQADVADLALRIKTDQDKIRTDLASHSTDIKRLAVQYDSTTHCISNLLDRFEIRPKRKRLPNGSLNGHDEGNLYLPAKLERAVRHICSHLGFDYEKF